MPTAPLHPSRPAAQAMVAAPSLASSSNKRKSPAESPRPAHVLDDHDITLSGVPGRMGIAEAGRNCPPVGMDASAAPEKARPASGRQTSACSATPSDRVSVTRAGGRTGSVTARNCAFCRD